MEKIDLEKCLIVVDYRPSVTDDCNILFYESKEQALKDYNENWLDNHSFSIEFLVDMLKSGEKHIATF